MSSKIRPGDRAGYFQRKRGAHRSTYFEVVVQSVSSDGRLARVHRLNYDGAVPVVSLETSRLRDVRPAPIEEASLDSPEVRDEVSEILIGGSMRWATLTLGDHVGAVIVFGSTQEEADSRARRLAAGWKLAIGTI